jgi:threonine/homoserine/homoserine lactone efflux protein
VQHVAHRIVAKRSPLGAPRGPCGTLWAIPAHLFPFLGVVAVITVLPGPDMALGVRNGVLGGRRATWITGVGCLTGLALWATASVLGLAAILAASGKAFDVVRIAGAVYLAFLGLGALRSALSSEADGGGRWPGLQATSTPAQPTDGSRTWFRQGLVSNLLNPKIALLFLTLLPQFVGAHEARAATTAKLAIAMLLVEIVWWAFFSAAVGAVSRALRRPSLRRAIEGLAGTLLVGLAVRIAAQR